MIDRAVSVKLSFSLVFSLLLALGPLVETTQAQKEATSPTKSVAIIPPEERPDLQVESKLQVPSGSDTLEATEEGTIGVTVINQGGGPAQNLQVRLRSKVTTQELQVAGTPLQSGDSIEVGRVSSLPASSSKTFTVPIQAANTLSGEDVTFAVEMDEKNGFVPSSPHTFAVKTKTYQPTTLEMAGFDVKGTDRQELRPDTTQSVSVRVKNTGETPARELRAEMQVVEGGGLPTIAGPIDVGTLEPKASTSLDVTLATTSNAQSLPLRVSFSSAEDPFETTETITIPVAEPDRPPIVDRNVPTTPTEREDAIAVVVGVRNYQSQNVPNVDYAARDAKTVEQYLTNTLGFKEGNVIDLINPTKAEMQSVFGTNRTHKGDLYDYLRTDSTEVFVYYSGHGAPNPEENGRTYFLPSNGSPRQLSITGYPVSQLYENLAKLTSGPVTVAIDACFSGQSGGGGTLIRNASPAMLNVENPMVGMKNGMVMTASKADQVSSWYSKKKHGLFTYFLLKGLRGEADQDRDSLITGLEIKTYLDENVSYYARRLHSRTQNPQVMGKGADRVLVRFSETASLKEEEGEPSGQQQTGSDASTETGNSDGQSTGEGSSSPDTEEPR